ncbi:MAG: hypothetical protein HQM07_06135 [Zetaproteobacteria bacterium]|nr:hypothetical protein [Zetaproteobacteria bacterium]
MTLTKSSVLNWFAFTIAILWFVKFKFIGELFVSELILFLVFLFMFKSYGKRLYSGIPKRIIIFGLLWLLAQIVTDVIRTTPFENMLRGWAAITFFLIDFAALYLLLGNNKDRLLFFIYGIAIGGVFRCFVAPSEYFSFEPWKFGFGFPVTLLTLLILTWAIRKRLFVPIVAEVVLFTLAVTSIYLNARSLGGALIITALLSFVGRHQIFYDLFLKRFNPSRLIAVSMVSLLLVFSVLVAYQWIGEAELLPDKSQAKYEMTKSSPFGLLGVILSGRIEILASIPAVIDSPVIGHGSWAEDQKYRQLLIGASSTLGVDRPEGELQYLIQKSDFIPAHSHLMQAWVWAGLLGAIFWVMVLILILKVLFQTLRNYDVLSLIVVFVCVKAGWDVLFSPFGSEMRIKWGWELVLIIMSFEMLHCSLKSDKEITGVKK